MSTRGARAGLLATAALFAGASFAQMPGPRPPEGMGPMPGFERLHGELKLNPQQEELWKKAQGLQRDEFRAMREKAASVSASLV